MSIADFLGRLAGVKPTRNPDAWNARCPAHDDHNASLSISSGMDGRILARCHAGCRVENIVAAMGLTIADLFPESGKARTPQIVATYDYTDEAGKLLFQAVRFEPKTFRQRRPDSALSDKWHWNLVGVPRVLYRLPEILKAVKAGRTIFAVEGEKDADTLAGAGFAATCNPMGAGKWMPEHSETLRGAARVVVVADKDSPGRNHAKAVASSLGGLVKTVKLLELPDADNAPVKDVTDWFAAGGTAKKLRAIVESTPEFVPSPEPQRVKPGSLAAEYLGGDDEEPEEPDPVSTAPAWPAPLAPAADHGLAGDVVRLIDRHTESDPAAVLVMFLASFGSIIGLGAHFMAEARRHPARVWPVLVGETAKGRKGSAWSSLRFFLERVDGVWLSRCVASGLSSGEGLIWAVRDPIVRQKRKGAGVIEETIEDGGVSDKRLLTVEEELSAVFKAASREGNTVSDQLRRAWDDGNMRTLTKNSPAVATGAHVTVIGHITRPDLTRLLSETDALNGFGNRFLWLAVKRSKLLPEGGELHTENLAPLTMRLHQALDHSRKMTLMKRSGAAGELWRTVYPVLSGDRFGVWGALTNRAEAQTMRLALIYALLDCSPQIETVHLEAALAVWDFCDRSTRFIFGEAIGDKLADRILDELRSAGSRGLTRNDIRQLFKGNISAAKTDLALSNLNRLNLAAWTKEPVRGAGRPAVVWRATSVRTSASPKAPAAVVVSSPPPQMEPPPANTVIPGMDAKAECDPAELVGAADLV